MIQTFNLLQIQQLLRPPTTAASFFKLPDETTDMVNEFNSNSSSSSILIIDLKSLRAPIVREGSSVEEPCYLGFVTWLSGSGFLHRCRYCQVRICARRQTEAEEGKTGSVRDCYEKQTDMRMSFFYVLREKCTRRRLQ
jgi:hypothetical protein